jgi:predicted CXXCH cytochrome family protein
MRSSDQKRLLFSIALGASLFGAPRAVLGDPAVAAVPAARAASSGVPASPPQAAPAQKPAEVEREALTRKRPERDANTCVSCHLTLADVKLRVVAERFQRSVHKDERIGCVACHKGNPNDPTVQAHDPASGFIVHPPHDQIAAICGGCHEDPTFIRRFSTTLPSDQKKLYELSIHGKLAGTGDSSAPTCSDCHGTHDIEPVASPGAPANRLRVVQLCARCHADKQYMAPYAIATDQVEKWKKSVHGAAVAAGSDAAPTCTGCHSPHAGTLPGTLTVAAFCGRCHHEERDLFLQSPHSRAFRKLGLAECVPCHGHHEVARATWLAGMGPDSACSRCHGKDEKPQQVARSVGALLTRVDQSERAVMTDLEDAKKGGLFVPEAVFALDQLRTERLRLVAQVHTLDLPRLDEQAELALGKAKLAQGFLDRARGERRIERRGYYVALGVAGLLFVLLLLKARELARRRTRSAS